MTSDTRSPQEIERDIEREREGLTDTLDELQDRLSVESFARQVSDQFREHGSDIGRSVSQAVKRNPVALALTGVGLAWLMLGDKDDRRGSYDHRRDYDDDRYRDARVTRIDRSRRDAGTLGPQPGDPAKPYYSGRYREDDLPSWARNPANYDDDQPGVGDRLKDAASGARKTAGDAASSVADTTRKAGAAVSDSAKKLGDSASSAGKSVSDSVSSAASTAADRAAALRERLAEGTENLTEEARNRVIAARERAIEARDAAMEYGRQGRERAADLYEEQPLVAGALAVAVGAALGAALPRSRTEDRYLGEQSDTLMAEAERIFAEEKEKLSKVASAATDEAKKIAEETKADADKAAPGGSLTDAVAEKAKSSGKRVADAAKDEAKKQNVGDVKAD